MVTGPYEDHGNQYSYGFPDDTDEIELAPAWYWHRDRELTTWIVLPQDFIIDIWGKSSTPDSDGVYSFRADVTPFKVFGNATGEEMGVRSEPVQSWTVNDSVTDYGTSTERAEAAQCDLYLGQFTAKVQNPSPDQLSRLCLFIDLDGTADPTETVEHGYNPAIRKTGYNATGYATASGSAVLIDPSLIQFVVNTTQLASVTIKWTTKQETTTMTAKLSTAEYNEEDYPFVGELFGVLFKRNGAYGGIMYLPKDAVTGAFGGECKANLQVVGDNGTVLVEGLDYTLEAVGDEPDPGAIMTITPNGRSKFVSGNLTVKWTTYEGMNYDSTYPEDAIEETPFRYENAGTADLLTVSGTTLGSLPATQSRTGTAFYQTQQAKCFDLPATPEVWMKFDVYFDGSNRWRAYNGGANGTCGVCSYGNYSGGDFGMWQNDTKIQDFSGICIANQLQTVLLHMVSGVMGTIEAWVDGNFIQLYRGDVNHGEDFADIYLQSDGAGTFFSNVIVSNTQIGFSENLY